MTVRKFQPIRTTNFAPSIAALGSAARATDVGFSRLRATIDKFQQDRKEVATEEAIATGLSKDFTTRAGVKGFTGGLSPDIAQGVSTALYKTLKGEKAEAAATATQERLEYGFEQLQKEDKRKEDVRSLTQEGIRRGFTDMESIQAFTGELDPSVSADVRKSLGANLQTEQAFLSSKAQDSRNAFSFEKDKYGFARTQEGDRKADALDKSWNSLFGSATESGEDILKVAQRQAKDMEPGQGSRLVAKAKDFQIKMGNLSEVQRAQMNIQKGQDLTQAKSVAMAGASEVSKAEAALKARPTVFDPAVVKKVAGSTNIGGDVQEILGPQYEDGFTSGVVNGLIAAVVSPKGTMTGDAATDYVKTTFDDVMTSGELTNSETMGLMIQAIKSLPRGSQLVPGNALDTGLFRDKVDELTAEFKEQKQMRIDIATMKAKIKLDVATTEKQIYGNQALLLQQMTGQNMPTPGYVPGTGEGPSWDVPDKRAPGFAARRDAEAIRR